MTHHKQYPVKYTDPQPTASYMELYVFLCHDTHDTQYDKKYLHENIKGFYKEKVSFYTLLTLIDFMSKSYDESYMKKQKIFGLYSQRSLS